MEDNNQKRRICPFNEGVICETEGSNCPCCGWSPDVSEARLIRFCSDNGIQYPGKSQEESEETEERSEEK